jgi:prepilin-type N-terminal cleavage/methylation domain-containing protein
MDNVINRIEGFTLIELVLAIVILSLAIIPILGFFINSIGIVDQTETHSQALDIAVDTTEYFKNVIENQMDSSNPTYLTDLQAIMDEFANDFNNDTVDNKLANYELFTNYILTIDANNVDTDLELVKVTVDISWDSGDRNIKLNTLVRRR